MTKRIASILCVTFFALAASAGAQTVARSRRAAAADSANYFPLAVGNSWTYASGRTTAQNGLTVRVTAEKEFNGNRYFQLEGFAIRSAWVRLTPAGQLVEFDSEGGGDRLWYEFQAPEGGSWRPQRPEECIGTAVITSRRAKADVPAGTFTSALQIDYGPTQCADAGYESELFAPNVGLVQRTETTIAGPRTLQLVQAQIGGRPVSPPGLSLSLSIDAPSYRADLMPRPTADSGIPQMHAQLAIQNSSDQPLALTLASGQQFDFVIRNERDEVVYQWSDGKAFTQALMTLDLSPGEQTFAADIELADKAGQLLPPGHYTLEGWLATLGGAPYRASVGFEMLEPVF